MKFSGNQDAGEDAARQYMQATVNFQKLRSELEVIEEGASDVYLYAELDIIKQLVEQL